MLYQPGMLPIESLYGNVNIMERNCYRMFVR